MNWWNCALFIGVCNWLKGDMDTRTLVIGAAIVLCGAVYTESRAR